MKITRLKQRYKLACDKPICMVNIALLLGWVAIFLVWVVSQPIGTENRYGYEDKEGSWRKPSSLFIQGKISTVQSRIQYMQAFLDQLHLRMQGQKAGRTTYHRIWKIYHDLVKEWLIPWDQEYLHLLQRQDIDTSQSERESRSASNIFLSIASFRDGDCQATLQQAFAMAKYPNAISCGLVQQNCQKNCQSGILRGSFSSVPVPPDDDCFQSFCASPKGAPHCRANRVRVLRVNESEALGPYMARYFASKMWDGEAIYIQLDSHMTFAPNWDVDIIDMLKNAPSNRPVISHYPPSLNEFVSQEPFPPSRICGAKFSPYEFSTIRLDGVGIFDKRRHPIPRFTPFVAAGFLATLALPLLREVPFDPLLPWIFMGEEIVLSARLWTHGFDFFAPTHNVVGHRYQQHVEENNRNNKDSVQQPPLPSPKFWESMGRLYWPGIHAPLQELVLTRIKFILKYPEANRDFVMPKSLLTDVESIYGLGSVHQNRTIDDFLSMAGIDPFHKQAVIELKWCALGEPPPNNRHLAYLYQAR